MKKVSLIRPLIGEFIGTWVLGGLGLSALAVSVTTGVLDYFGTLFVFCFIVGLAVIYVGPISGAHLNPAVTLAMGIFGDFPKKRILPFCIVQVFGTFVGALTVYLLFGNAITAYEISNSIVRGSPESAKTAMIFCCFTPHPFISESAGWDSSIVGNGLGILSEIIGTTFLVFSVYSFNDKDNALRPRKGMFGFMIGLVLLVYCSIFGPLSMGCVNPARDLGPRIAAAILGWGKVVFPGLPSGQGGSFWIYIIGPFIGGILGTALWKKVCKPIILKNKQEDAIKK